MNRRGFLKGLVVVPVGAAVAVAVPGERHGKYSDVARKAAAQLVEKLANPPVLVKNHEPIDLQDIKPGAVMYVHGEMSSYYSGPVDGSLRKAQYLNALAKANLI